MSNSSSNNHNFTISIDLNTVLSDAAQLNSHDLTARINQLDMQRKERLQKELRLKKKHTLSSVMCSLRIFQENDYLGDVKKLAKQLNQSKKELTKLKNEDNYAELVKLAVAEYHENSNEEVDKSLKDFVETLNIDVDRLVYDKYTSIVVGFVGDKPYWENQISSLKRESAVKNRRQYLIEKIEEMILLCKQNNRNDLMLTLNEYKDFQQDQLKVKQ